MASTTTAPQYSDFTTSFVVHPVSNDLGRVTDFEAVRRSIKNLILTDKYERLLDPNIGSNIKRCLFEPMDGATTVMLQNYIRDTIKNYEPRARLVDVIVTPDYNNNAYHISIYFTVTFSEKMQTVTFYLNRVR
jgi:phage baseplate assembly protein W